MKESVPVVLRLKAGDVAPTTPQTDFVKDATGNMKVVTPVGVQTVATIENVASAVVAGAAPNWAASTAVEINQLWVATGALGTVRVGDLLRSNSASTRTTRATFDATEATFWTEVSAEVVVNNTLTSTSTTEALSAAQGKALQDGKVDKTQTGVTQPVRAVTTAALPANTVASGVMTATANAALAAQDGVSLAVGDRLLVKNEATAANNGIYTVTNLGSATTKWVLTRATDFDGTPVGEVVSGVMVPVSEGTTQLDSLWLLTTNGTITVGTTALAFSRIDYKALLPSLADNSILALFDTMRARRPMDKSSTDLNSLFETGFYDGQTLTNAPNADSGWWHLIVTGHSNITSNAHQQYVMQMARRLNDNAQDTVWVRTSSANTWGAWRALAFREEATTTESLAGYRYNGAEVYVRMFTGTMPAVSTNVALFTPSTGAASRLIEFKGHVMRSGTDQRHPINQITPDSTLSHASCIYQTNATGVINLFHANAAFASQAYSVAIYYTK